MRRTLAAIAFVAVSLALAACCCENRCRPCGSPCARVVSPDGRAVPGVVVVEPATRGGAGSIAILVAPVAPPAPAAPDAAAPYNATCPVLLGNPVDARYTTIHKGKVVGFCCPMCKAKFEKDPEKYAKNLP